MMVEDKSRNMMKQTSTLHKELTGIQEEDNISNNDESKIRSKAAPIDLKEKI
jgi:hypothetical protein